MSNTFFFFFNDTATTEIYTLSLHDALPICILRRRYGEYAWSGPGRILDSIVGTILSQNTSDINSTRAYRSLRRRFPSWTKVMNAPVREVADAIRVGGLANNKSRWIRDLLRWVKRTRGRMSLEHLRSMTPGEVLARMGHLNGIGVKTVYVTMMFACGQDVFPVDTHVHRIVRRLKLVPWSASREKTTELMQPLVAKGRKMTFHVNLIRFGREICRARGPVCPACALGKICTWSGKTTD